MVKDAEKYATEDQKRRVCVGLGWQHIASGVEKYAMEGFTQRKVDTGARVMISQAFRLNYPVVCVRVESLGTKLVACKVSVTAFCFVFLIPVITWLGVLVTN